MSDTFYSTEFNGTTTTTINPNENTIINASSTYSNPIINSGSEKKTLYVGNLDPDVTELMVSTVFSPFGQLLSVKIMRDANNRFDPYAFIEFIDPVAANLALSAMNHIKFMDRELRVNWATSNQNSLGKQGHSIFVGDLSLDVDDKNVHDAFMVFGPIIEAKVVRYTDGRSRGYAFICFENESDAEEAILKMDRSWLMGKSIRCNWATKKPAVDNKPVQAKRYEDVLLESTVSNCTVYFGGIMEGLNEELVRENFEEYKPIIELKVFVDKGFAFVKLKSHEIAAKAITQIHGREINGYQSKCAWGKENFSILLAGGGSASGGGGGTTVVVNSSNNNTSSSGGSGVQPSPGTTAAIAYNSSATTATASNYDEYWRQYYAYCQQYYEYYQNYYGSSGGGGSSSSNNGMPAPSPPVPPTDPTSNGSSSSATAGTAGSNSAASGGGGGSGNGGYYPPYSPYASSSPQRGGGGGGGGGGSAPPPQLPRYRIPPPPGFRPPPQSGFRPAGGPMRSSQFRPQMRGPYPPPSHMRYRGPPPPGPSTYR